MINYFMNAFPTMSALLASMALSLIAIASAACHMRAFGIMSLLTSIAFVIIAFVRMGMQ